jgi:hypothetical protein
MENIKMPKVDEIKKQLTSAQSEAPEYYLGLLDKIGDYLIKTRPINVDKEIIFHTGNFLKRLYGRLSWEYYAEIDDRIIFGTESIIENENLINETKEALELIFHLLDGCAGGEGFKHETLESLDGIQKQLGFKLEKLSSKLKGIAGHQELFRKILSKLAVTK